MKKTYLLLFFCLTLSNFTFGETNQTVKFDISTFMTTVTQTKHTEKSWTDTVKKNGVKVKEVKESKKEKNSEAADFEFLTKLPVIKTFISGIVSIVKGVSKLVD